MRLKQDEKIHEMALKQKRDKEAGLFDHLGYKYIFLEWQPCHSPVMVLCSTRPIYQGFVQCPR